MKLSIIISTFNRAIQLDQLLEDLVYQFANLSESEAEQVEVILIDNNSNDNTKEIAYKYAESTAVTLKHYVESQQGLAVSRNQGIKQANGDLLVFLDDDVTLDDDWLSEVFKIADECRDRELGVYGGRVVPLWQERTPKWLSTEPPYETKQEVFSGHSYGEDEKYYPLEFEEHQARQPIGTHMMFRKEIFENCGDFRTDLGTNASGGLGLYEDREFLEYLAALNVPMLYVPQCVVFHPVAPERMTKQAIRRWYLKEGKSLYWMWHTDRMRREPNPLVCIPEQMRAWFPSLTHKIKVSGVPIYLYIKLAMLFCSFILMHLSFNEKRIFWSGLQLSRTLGEIEGAALLAKHKKTKRFTFEDRVMKNPYIKEMEAAQNKLEEAVRS